MDSNKLVYETPEVEVNLFETEDIIQTSGITNANGKDNDTNWTDFTN